MTEEQKKEEETGYVDRYNEKAIRNRRKFPGGEEETGFVMSGDKVPKTTDPKTEEYNLF